MRKVLIIPILLLSFFIQAQNEGFKAYSRFNYYTNELHGQIMVIIPDSLVADNITIGIVYKNEHLVQNYPITFGEKTGLIPFGQLNTFPFGEDTVVCSYYVYEKWVGSDWVIIQKLPHKNNAVKIDHYSGGLVVDNLPFVPFGFYAYSPVQPTLIEEEAVKGFNMFSPYQKIDGKRKSRKQRIEYLNRCEELGIKVHYHLQSVSGGGGVGSTQNQALSEEEKLYLLKEEVLAIKDHPALLAWYMSDEPVGQGVEPGKLKKYYKLIKELDPYHPVTIVFMTPSKALEYTEMMDIVMSDPYPIPNGSVTEVEKITRQLYDEFYPQKPVWIVPQAFGGNEWWQREPTPQELRVMTYLAIINGAKGIQYFIRHGLNSFPKSTKTWNEASNIAIEIAELIPDLTLYSKWQEIETGITSIRGIRIETPKYATYIFVNTENRPAKLVIGFQENFPFGDAEVLFENRILEVQEGTATDFIDGLNTRIYRVYRPQLEKIAKKLHANNYILDPSFELSPVAGIPMACYARPNNDRGATYFTDTRVSFHEMHSLRLTAPDDDQGMNLSFYSVKVPANRSYTLSVMAMAKNKSVIDKNKGFFYNLFHKKEDQHIKFALRLNSAIQEKFNLSQMWEKYQISGIIPGNNLTSVSPSLQLLSRGTAWLDMLQLIPDIETFAEYTHDEPVIKVKINTLQENGVIRYTIDGTNPTPNSTIYVSPVALDKPTNLKMGVFTGIEKTGYAEEKFYVHKATGAKVNYQNSYAGLYAARGDLALVDGKKGSIDLKDGHWQGFLLKDLDIVIQLNEVKPIKNISAGFLQDQNAWVFLPEIIEISLSENGNDFSHLKTIEIGLPEKNSKRGVKNFTADFENVPAKYVKVKAKAVGMCPEWHKGNGKPAWLFVDEVIIE